MNLFDTISEEIKNAMKAREQLRLETLRGIKKEFIEAKTAKENNGELTDEVGIKILQKLIKQRKTSAEIYSQQGRVELAAKEEQEAEIIATFLPQQISADELEKIIKEIVAATGATTIKEMGKVMAQANAALAGKAEPKDISAIVKKLLS